MAPGPSIPLILLPGLLCDRALWAPQIAALSDIADIGVADLSQADTMSSMADTVLAMAPERFALAGLSMGGYVAFEVFLRAPHRISRLALLDTQAGVSSPAAVERARALMKLAERGEFKGVTHRLLPLLIHPSRMSDAALTATVMAMTARVGRDAYLRQQLALLGRVDSRPGLARITCPTLVLCGREDQLTPVERHREMAADIANARLVVVDECGHLSPLERPDEVNRAMRIWLSQD
ncbi:MAG: alpha/beta fold hydrolase [Proteobacteria bacterium]|nr:alpha/beta fold hydrolase [Pseudomonadota bacterium]